MFVIVLVCFFYSWVVSSFLVFLPLLNEYFYFYNIFFIFLADLILYLLHCWTLEQTLILILQSLFATFAPAVLAEYQITSILLNSQPYFVFWKTSASMFSKMFSGISNSSISFWKGSVCDSVIIGIAKTFKIANIFINIVIVFIFPALRLELGQWLDFNPVWSEDDPSEP